MYKEEVFVEARSEDRGCMGSNPGWSKCCVKSLNEIVVLICAIEATVSFFYLLKMPGSNIWTNVFNRDFEGIQQLLVNEDVDIDQKGGPPTHYSTPLQLAISMHEVAIAELLLHHGADPNVLYKGATPMHQMLRVPNQAILTLLFRYRVNIEAKNGQGVTPLVEAAIGHAANPAAIGHAANPVSCTSSALPSVAATMKSVASLYFASGASLRNCSYPVDRGLPTPREKSHASLEFALIIRFCKRA